MEAYGADINDRPLSLPGDKQRILFDGYQIPLHFKNGLASLPCRKPADDERGTLPHVIMTSDVDWDPCVYDNIIDDIVVFHDPSIDLIEHDNPFDDYGEYRHRTVATHKFLDEEELFDSMECVDYDNLVDDLMNAHNPTVVDNIYNLQPRKLCPNHPILSCFDHSLVRHRPTLASALSM
jgi:hypothetical protein